MKLGTLILGIIGNVLKIRGNLERICGSWEGGRGILSIWPPLRLSDYYNKNEAKIA